MDDYHIEEGAFSPQSPQFMQNVKGGGRHVSKTETVNLVAPAFVKDAQGSTLVIDLQFGPILSQSGGEIGSFWGLPRNRQYFSSAVEAVTEADGSAAFSVRDSNVDLEKLFESTGSARYVAKITDGAGNELYGWIGGVAVASGLYTFDIYNGVGLGTQNWFQGGATNFDFAANGIKIVEIYRYTSSIVFGTADTFLEEKPYRAPLNQNQVGQTEFNFLKSLSDGEYGVDYKNGKILVRKGDADNTEAITYKTYVSGDCSEYSTDGPTSGKKVITTAGSPEALVDDPTPCAYVDVQAYFGNAGNIALGDSSVDASATLNTGTGVILQPGGSYTIHVDDLSKVFLDVLNNGDGVRFNYYL